MIKTNDLPSKDIHIFSSNNISDAVTPGQLQNFESICPNNQIKLTPHSKITQEDSNLDKANKNCKNVQSINFNDKNDLRENENKNEEREKNNDENDENNNENPPSHLHLLNELLPGQLLAERNGQNNMGRNADNNENLVKSDEERITCGFNIDIGEIEKIVSFYKERDSNYLDVKYFINQKGDSKLLSALKCDTEFGLTNSKIDLELREKYFGSNKIFRQPIAHFCVYVWEALEDLMVRILIVAAIIQMILGFSLSENKTDWIDGLSIIFAVLIVVLVGSVTNYKKEMKFYELNEIKEEGTKHMIIRNGETIEINNDNLLVGDLVIINYGEIMPADMLIIEGNSIKMDESALTGESEAMKKESVEQCMKLLEEGNVKSLPSPIILSGTNCIEGTGKAIVLAVGEHSLKGIIRRTVDNAKENSKTPLEEKLEVIAQMIGYFGLCAGIITFLALIVRFLVSYKFDKKDYNRDSQIESILTAYLQNIPSSTNNKKITSRTNNKLRNPKKMIPNNILDIIILCISIIVVAIPEGLPLAVTLSLAFSIKKLMDFNNLVRKMHACETMGGANYICTDKTGTLTKNIMSICMILTGKGIMNVNTTKNMEGIGEIENNINDNNINYNNNKENPMEYFKSDSFQKIENTNQQNPTQMLEAKNKTDSAFIEFLNQFNVDILNEKEKYMKNCAIPSKIYPFDSKRKRMTTFIHNDKFPSKYRLFTKGGGENSLNFCKFYLDPDTGEKVQLTDDNLSFIKQSMEEVNKNKLRSLYVAYKDITEEEFNNCEKCIEEEGKESEKMIDQKDLVFLGVFGIKDPLRDGVKEAVVKCHEASVNVIMVTGDNIITATAIAKECNILGRDVDLRNLTSKEIEEDPEMINDENNREKYINKLLENKPRALTGKSFYTAIGGLICEICTKSTNMCQCPKTEAEAKSHAEKFKTKEMPVKKDIVKNMDNFRILIKRLRVMARSQPIHKYALVVGLKALKNVVAVTGDGTNDAPALSKSDVGFSMFAGTDIAKEASDIVILDNNFSSIVVAIIYGRNIYDNIRKFLQFQLTVNFSACILVFVCGCIGNETPLTPIQMLWVNLIMDSLGSLALATETPYSELLKRKPTRRNESIINGTMWKHIIFQCIALLSILLIFYLHAPKFIKENNLKRLSENYILNACYDSMPGGTDPNYIIYGTKDKWTANINIKDWIDHIDCGMYKNYQNLSVAYKLYLDATGSTTHMTLIFNVFVFYTLFNQINSRILDDSLNIFKRLNKSILFIVITLCEIALQVLIIFIGNEAFHVVENGITAEQWGITLGFSLITFVVSIIAKFVPLDKKIDSLLNRHLDDFDVYETDNLQFDKSSNNSNINKIKKIEPQKKTNNNNTNRVDLIESGNNSSRGLRDISGSTLLRLSENRTPISININDNI